MRQKCLSHRWGFLCLSVKKQNGMFCDGEKRITLQKAILFRHETDYSDTETLFSGCDTRLFGLRQCQQEHCHFQQQTTRQYGNGARIRCG